MTRIERPAQPGPNSAEVVLIADAAAECGASVAEFISWELGLRGAAGSPRNRGPEVPAGVSGDILRHISDCGCGFIASPHPDIAPMGEAGAL